MGTLATLDWLLIGLYFAVIFAVAWWVAGRKKETHRTTAGYFLAGRNVGWFVVGAALFASNIGSEHLEGLAGTGYDSGVAVGQFEVLASLILLILGWVFVPFYLRSGVYTMPEFLERRYSSATRWYLAVISIVAYVLTKISVTLYAGGVVYEVLLGGGFWTGALIIVLATGIYTVLGGLRAVLYTEMLQTIMLIGGAGGLRPGVAPPRRVALGSVGHLRRAGLALFHGLSFSGSRTGGRLEVETSLEG